MKLPSRLFFLNIFLATGFSVLFFLPKSYGLRESAIVKALPKVVDDWKGYPQETPEKVRKILGTEVSHEQSIYIRPVTAGSKDAHDRISVFMVISGSEMNAGIHRPERCLPAQGFTITDHSSKEIQLSTSTALDITRLNAFGYDSEQQRVPRVSYYWFVGHDRVTNSHYERTIIDMKDRILKGYNQRWAYVMATIEYGADGTRGSSRSEAEADRLLKNFVGRLFPFIHKTEKLKH